MTEAEALHRAWILYGAGFVALILTAVQLRTGVSLERGPQMIIRAEKPVSYWLNVILTGAGSVAFFMMTYSRIATSEYRTAAMGLAIVSLLGVAFLARAAVLQYKQERTEFTKPIEFPPAAETNTDVAVFVRGWSKPELDRILTDFLRGYELRGLTAHINAIQDDVLLISFVPNIDPDKLMFLVNYIQYPKNFDLKRRRIAVSGRVRLSAVLGPPDPKLEGHWATIYVPADDTEYDLVYAQVEGGGAFEISFTNMAWKPVREARMPASIAGLCGTSIQM